MSSEIRYSMRAPSIGKYTGVGRQQPYMPPRPHNRQSQPSPTSLRKRAIVNHSQARLRCTTSFDSPFDDPADVPATFSDHIHFPFSDSNSHEATVNGIAAGAHRSSEDSTSTPEVDNIPPPLFNIDHLRGFSRSNLRRIQPQFLGQCEPPRDLLLGAGAHHTSAGVTQGNRFNTTPLTRLDSTFSSGAASSDIPDFLQDALPITPVLSQGAPDHVATSSETSSIACVSGPTIASNTHHGVVQHTDPRSSQCTTGNRLTRMLSTASHVSIYSTASAIEREHRWLHEDCPNHQCNDCRRNWKYSMIPEQCPFEAVNRDTYKGEDTVGQSHT